VDAAVDVFTRKIDIVSRRYDVSSVAGKTKAVDEVLALVAQVPNDVGRQLTVDAAVRALSNAFDIEDRVLRARFDQMRRRRRTVRRPSDEQEKPARTHDTVERDAIEALLAVPELVPQLLEVLTPDDFEDEGLRPLFKQMNDLYESSGTVNASRLLGALDDPELVSFVSGIITSPVRPGLESTGLDCKKVLLKRRTEKKTRSVQKELEQAKASGNEKLVDDANIRIIDYRKLEQQAHTL